MTSPYYNRDGITIYHGDCRPLLAAGIIDADVLVSDPPYGMAYQSGWNEASAVANDDTPDARDTVLALWSPRPALVFGRWSVPRPAATRMLLIWDKGDWPGMGDLKLPWGPSTEEIYVIGDGWRGKRGGQILRNPARPNAQSVHPTEKPVGLMEKLIAACPPGIILDPFMGSGTTLVAARNLGRRAVGCEIEQRYCEVAIKRLAQGNLFGGVA